MSLARSQRITRRRALRGAAHKRRGGRWQRPQFHHSAGLTAPAQPSLFGHNASRLRPGCKRSPATRVARRRRARTLLRVRYGPRGRKNIRREIKFSSSRSQFRHHVVRNIEIGEDVLHVLVVFQCGDQLQERLSLVCINGGQVLRLPDDVGRCGIT